MADSSDARPDDTLAVSGHASIPTILRRTTRMDASVSINKPVHRIISKIKDQCYVIAHGYDIRAIITDTSMKFMVDK
jgi:hypothetical protein